jgi:PTS system nitrogen regulatory IIA component
MRSLLDALQEGRLIELPDSSKEKALEYLALLIEAIPDIGTKTDLVKGVSDRENQFNTGLGKGVAVPHCRTQLDGELLCAVGWAPKGIDYGASDGKKVHLIIMYYVPDAQRNLYLKEISGLAKVLSQSDTIEQISELGDIHTVREKLIDWVGLAIGAATPDAKARMIQLDARQASIETAEKISPQSPLPEKVSRFVPLRVISFGDQALILSTDNNLVNTLEALTDLSKKIRSGTFIEVADWKVAILSETGFSHGRKIYEAVAYR